MSLPLGPNKAPQKLHALVVFLSLTTSTDLPAYSPLYCSIRLSMDQPLSSTDFATQEGTLYPLLSKLRREGLVNYEWQESESGPPRKYYGLTPAGRQHLAELDEYWAGIGQTVTDLRS